MLREYEKMKIKIPFRTLVLARMRRVRRRKWLTGEWQASCVANSTPNMLDLASSSWFLLATLDSSRMIQCAIEKRKKKSGREITWKHCVHDFLMAVLEYPTRHLVYIQDIVCIREKVVGQEPAASATWFHHLHK